MEIIIVIIIAVVLLKGFDMIAGRGSKQVKDGISKSTVGRHAHAQSDAHDMAETLAGEGIAPRKPASELEENRIPCPFCAEKILPEAKKCRFCGSEL